VCVSVREMERERNGNRQKEGVYICGRQRDEETVGRRTGGGSLSD